MRDFITDQSKKAVIQSIDGQFDEAINEYFRVHERGMRQQIIADGISDPDTIEEILSETKRDAKVSMIKRFRETVRKKLKEKKQALLEQNETTKTLEI